MSQCAREKLQIIAQSRLEKFGRHLFETTDLAENAPPLEIPRVGQLTLYGHIPFCERICSMCPFYKMLFETGRATKYLEAFEKQLQYYTSLRSFPEVYIGGGTPATVLPALMQLAEKYRIGQKQFSLEAHPGDLTEENLQLMLGTVTRLSVGVQTTDPQLLERLHRNNGCDTLQSLARAVGMGFAVNADLIFNIPGQTIEQFLTDLDTLIKLGVTQITCYPLMAAPGVFVNVDDSREAEFYAAMVKRFQEFGYWALSPWCFTNTKPNELAEDRQGEYISNKGGQQDLALGASGISMIGDTFSIAVFDLDEYHQRVMAGLSPVLGSRTLSRAEKAQYVLLTSLFGMQFDISGLPVGRSGKTLIQAELRVLQALGVVTRSGNIVNVTPAGMAFVGGLMKEFYTGLNFFRDQYKKETLLR